ncbi:unnamed protein product [Caretta caretta]
MAWQASTRAKSPVSWTTRSMSSAYLTPINLQRDSKSTRNDYTYQETTKKLAVLGIHRTGDQGREWVEQLKTNYQKPTDENGTSGNTL